MSKLFADKSTSTVNSDYTILLSTSFILGLIILIVNDHYLKPEFPGIITGKLSDFAGLYIFPLFFSVFFPDKKKLIYISTFIFFIYWKLPQSDVFIEFWNNYAIFKIGRTVDYTDYIALSILPISYFYKPKKVKLQHSRLLTFTIASISFFAFCATSPERKLEARAENYHNGFIQKKRPNLWCKPNENICIVKDYESSDYRGYRLLDSNGRELNAQQYAVIRVFQYNQLLISSSGKYEGKADDDKYSGGLWGVMTYKGKVLVKPTYEEVRAFESDNVNKMFVGKTNNRWALIDSLGQTILEPVFDGFYAINDNLIAVSLRNKYSIVDINGNFVIPFKIDRIEKVNSSDTTKIRIDGSLFLIDLSGKIIE